MLDGYKTYIAAIVSVMSAWASVWAGQLDQATAAHMTETAILAMTIRRGIATSVK